MPVPHARAAKPVCGGKGRLARARRYRQSDDHHGHVAIGRAGRERHFLPIDQCARGIKPLGTEAATIAVADGLLLSSRLQNDDR